MSTTIKDYSGAESPSLAPPATAMPERVHFDGGEFGLLLPAADVVTLLSIQTLIAPAETSSPLAAQTCGYLDFDQQRYPVFCLNKALQLQSRLETHHRVLVLLRHQQQFFALACSSLNKLDTREYPVYPVPRSMSSRKQPFNSFALINDAALGLSSAADLLELLQVRGVQIRAQNSRGALQGAG